MLSLGQHILGLLFTCTHHLGTQCGSSAARRAHLSNHVTMIVRKISEKRLQIGKLSRAEKLEKRGTAPRKVLKRVVFPIKQVTLRIFSFLFV